MAAGQSSEQIYKLLEELGGEENAQTLVFNNLVKYLPREELDRFVKYFRQNYDWDDHFTPDTDDVTEDFEFNEYEICMSCQDTHHADEQHTCSEDSIFFSSRIPSC